MVSELHFRFQTCFITNIVGEVGVNSSNCGKVEVNSSFIIGEAGVLKSFIGGKRGELDVERVISTQNEVTESTQRYP